MKFASIPTGAMNHVDGVFGMNPVVPGEAVQLGRNKKGIAELLQGGRVVAISDTKPQLLSFAAINRLPVVDYTDRHPALDSVASEPPVFTID
jgi:hypothetical protein